MSTSTSIYQILKAIDFSYENNNFKYETTFNLEKLKISKQRLELLLENLTIDNYIQGISIKRDSNGNAIVCIGKPRLTNSGLIYLEENSSMKKAYETLKEIKGWIPGI
ncbi:MAG: YjcQ family protein [Clostridium sp.]